MGNDRKKKPSIDPEKLIEPEKKPVTRDTDLVYYIQLVKKRIYTQWVIPGALRSQQGLPVVKVKVAIARNGTLGTIDFISSSDNELLNRSILDAIQNASPFPPFPAGLTDESLTVIINFDTEA